MKKDFLEKKKSNNGEGGNVSSFACPVLRLSMKAAGLSLLLLLFTLFSCRDFKLDWISENHGFRPPEGYIYLFAGETPEEIGGMEAYADGYCDHVGLPAGLSFNIPLGDPAEDISLYEKDHRFDNLILSLGIDFSGRGKAVNNGEYDDEIKALGSRIQTCGRPVFLRIGYGWDLTDPSYDPREYRKAYRRIADGIRTMAPGKTVMVWQAGSPEPEPGRLTLCYPGDDYCDWIGIPIRRKLPPEDGILFALAEKKDKPLMIIPAFPVGLSFSSDDADMIWETWFTPLLGFVDEHRERIAAVVYRSLPPGILLDTDTAFQGSPELLIRWQRELREPGWIHRTLIETESPERTEE